MRVCILMCFRSCFASRFATLLYLEEIVLRISWKKDQFLARLLSLGGFRTEKLEFLIRKSLEVLREGMFLRYHFLTLSLKVFGKPCSHYPPK